MGIRRYQYDDEYCLIASEFEKYENCDEEIARIVSLHYGKRP